MSQYRAIIYTRVSSDEQAESGTSLDSQRDACLRKAEAMGAIVVGHRTDEGVSGAKLRTRSGVLAALADIEAGRADTLISYDVSRLSRDRSHQEEIRKRVSHAGGRLVFVTQSFENTADGDLMFDISGDFAKWERQKIRERVMSGKRAMAESGVMPQRAASPYGYHIVTKLDKIAGRFQEHAVGEYVVIEELVGWIQTIYSLYDGGWSLIRIAAWLQAQGLPTTKGGKRWYPSTVRTILGSSVYKGMAVYGRRETISGEELTFLRDPTRHLKAGQRLQRRDKEDWILIPVPAIIATDLWERCQIRLQANANEKKAILGGNPQRKYMLTGLTRCPVCGWRMGARCKKGIKSSTTYYICAQNPECSATKSIWRADVLEDLVIRGLLALCERPEAIAEAIHAYDAHQRSKEETARREAEREGITAELRNLDSELAMTKQMMLQAMRAGLTTDDFTPDFERIAQKRAVLEERLAGLTPRPRSRGEEPMAAALKMTRVIQAIRDVFTTTHPKYTAAVKQSLLAPLVESIIPEWGDIAGVKGIEIRFRSQTLQCIKLRPFVTVD